MYIYSTSLLRVFPISHVEREGLGLRLYLHINSLFTVMHSLTDVKPIPVPKPSPSPGVIIVVIVVIMVILMLATSVVTIIVVIMVRLRKVKKIVRLGQPKKKMEESETGCPDQKVHVHICMDLVVDFCLPYFLEETNRRYP